MARRGNDVSEQWSLPPLERGAIRAMVGDQLRGDGARVTVVAVGVAVSAAIVAAVPSVIRWGIDDGIAVGDSAVLQQAVLVFLGLLVAGGIADGLRSMVMTTVGQRFLHRLRCDALGGILRIELDDYERCDRGDLQTRVSSHVERLAGASEHLIPDMTSRAIAIVAGLVGVAVLSPVLALLALAAVPPAIVAGAWLRRRSRVVYPEMLRRHADAVGVVVETIEGSATIASHRAGARQRARTAATDARWIDVVMDATAMRNWFYSTLLIVQAVSTAIIVAVGAVLASQGTITVGTTAAAILALAGVFGPLSLLVGQLDDLFSAAASLTRVAELALVPTRAGGGEVLPHRGVLELSGVSFAYGDGEPVVEGIDLRVLPGERVALVGPTGAGKSTIARLAVGLSRPGAGTVTLDGVDVNAVAPADRRDHLLLVAQESFLVAGSVADNARLAHPDLPDSAVETAIDQLALRSWISSLPEGIHTDVGPAGSRLSAGERQLVALLRVAMADPAVVVLDEATSVLDATTEAAVAAALARLCAGRSVLIVAHRRTTAARCDRVAVIEAGRLAEVGSHDDLEARGGAYASLWAGAAEQ